MKKLIIGLTSTSEHIINMIMSMFIYIHRNGIGNANYNNWKSSYNNFINDIEKSYINYFDDISIKLLSIVYNIPINYFYDKKYLDKYYCLTTGNIDTYDTIKQYNNIHIIPEDIINIVNLSVYLQSTNIFGKLAYIKLSSLITYFNKVLKENMDKDIIIKFNKNNIYNISFVKGLCIIPNIVTKDEAACIKFSDNVFHTEIIKLINNESGIYTEDNLKTITKPLNYYIAKGKDELPVFYKVLNIYSKLIEL